MKRRSILPAVVFIVLLFSVAAPLAVKVYGQGGWRVTLVASLGAYSSTTILGVESDATDGFDIAYDAVAPPPPPQGVYSYFWYPDNPSSPNLRRLSTSIIPPSGNMNWTLRVTPVGLEDTIVLNWTDVPPQYEGYIKDSTGTTVLADMNQVSEYSYAGEMDIMVTFTVNLVIPDFAIGPILALIVCFASYGAFKVYRRF